MESFLLTIYDVASLMWVELCFMAFFSLGFALLSQQNAGGSLPMKRKKAAGSGSAAAKRAQVDKLRRVVEAEVSAGNASMAIKAWRKAQADFPTPIDTLKLITHAFVSSDPGRLVIEIVGHLETHPKVHCNARAANAVLEVLAHAGLTQLMDETLRVIQERLQITPTDQTYDVLLGGHAGAGDEARVTFLCNKIRSSGRTLTARSFALIIKGFLRHGLVDAALGKIREMRRHGHYIPPYAISLLIRAACTEGRMAEALQQIECEVVLPPESVAFILEDCCKRSDIDLARRVERLAQESKVPLLTSSYDALLKLLASVADIHALELFEEMQQSPLRISEGLCVALLARCAEAKFLRFAEEIVRYVRTQDGVTVALYSALMKVYAYSGMYDKACDLYDQLLAEGLEPDMVMYGCLAKFAMACGRTDLSRDLFERAPSLVIQNYMSLIRAAGRDKDVGRAFAVLEMLNNSGAPIDVMAYNCVLDVCVSAGDMKRACSLVEEMKGLVDIDIITFNTLLKGYCAIGDANGTKGILREIERAGLRPNQISYNCMINAAVSSGNMRTAWDTIATMESSGTSVDHYTVSIMLKALKKVRSPSEVSRSLALLDRSGVDVCSDEVLLNTVLETCIRHKEQRRLSTVLSAFDAACQRPSVSNYGPLIKAFSTLGRLDRCRDLWRDLVEVRGLEPNDVVLGCILDACVCNCQVEEAVALFRKWKSRVPPNAFMYSTLVKGFASGRQAAAAMDLWREMREDSVVMNTVVYNSLIDAQARDGAMQAVSELVTSMQADGLEPDTITYSTIVKGYCRQGNVDKAVEVFRDMQRMGMASDTLIYNTVLDGCTWNNRPDLADQILEDMERHQVVPSNITLGILVKMYGRRKQLHKAFNVLERLPKRHGFKPNSQVMTCLMCACLNNGAVDRAFDIFEDLKRASGVDGADARVYSVLVGGLLRHGLLERAVEVVEEAYDRGQGTFSGAQALSEALEKLLWALRQRGLMEKLGAPFLERLRATDAPINWQQLIAKAPWAATTSAAAAVAQPHQMSSGRR
mmetsp:Transcript_51436/g.110068  ORF Transcript_51436/g.110068 Transcript_51436/m.110068 type:complete len:1039 (-) Transcript_51436:95-3211(-)